MVDARQSIALLTELIPEADKEECSIPLGPQGTWPASDHLMSSAQLNSIIAAIAANRPLLVRGEPGIGKSQLARAAATILKRHFISFVIQPSTEHQDLLWSIDHLQRLGDAQLMQFQPQDERSEWLQPANYMTPGPLWHAFDPFGDKPIPRTTYDPEEIAEGCITDNGFVVLLDEIDKADISVCQGLLEVLGNGAFTVPHWKSQVISDRERPPLVVITSNDTRQLPSAFLRRCVLLDLVLPTGEELVEHLTLIGKVHFPELSEAVRQRAARQTVSDRANGTDLVRSGQAEYLDLLRTLGTLAEKESEQIAWLKKLSRYFLKSANVQ